MRPQPDRPRPTSRPAPRHASATIDDIPQLPAASRRPAPSPRSAFPRYDGPPSAFFDRPIDERDDDERRGLLSGVTALVSRLRCDPHAAQRGSLGVIGAGVALFVVASIATPLASAETKHQRTVAKPRPVAVATSAATTASSTPAAAPAARQVLKRKPTHAKQQAAVDHGTISGLAANGIPKVALNAYRVAAARMAHVEPGCGIDWALLAGIGREESDHGRFGGARLHADGTSTPRIVGPALDGKHSDYIPAPGNGQALAGDATFAHALGPMQFIPSTWAGYGADATGDGKADIFNINDAALGSARYLCAAGGNLRTHAGQVAAVLTYNHSDEYLAQVLALAEAYRTGVPVTGIPTGNTSGTLPTIVDTGYIPPANPGPPTAVDKQNKKKAATKAAAAKRAAAKKKAATHKTSTSPKPRTTSQGTNAVSGSNSGGGTGSASGPTTTTPGGGANESSSPTKPPSTGAPPPAKTCTLADVLKLKCKLGDKIGLK